jgi:glycine/D-amino acid oxidase-like deaminating enzyme
MKILREDEVKSGNRSLAFPCETRSREKARAEMTTMNDGKEKESTRRKFLKTAAIATAGTVAGAAGINAVSPDVLPEEMIFEPNPSYWARALPAVNPALRKDVEVDVAIIGGGFTGLSAGYYLKKAFPKVQVVLLEAKRCGNGASGRNGAMMLTATADRYMQGSGNASLDKRIYDLTVENIRSLKELSATLGIDAEIEQDGALQVCNTREMAEEGRRYIEKARAAGFPSEFWDKHRIGEAIGTNAYEGALFDPNSGQVHPGKLVGLFKVAAESVGVEIFEQSQIIHVVEGDPIKAVTKNGPTVRARSLVLATNAYSSKLGYLRRAVTPVFDYVGITAPLSESRISEIGWRKRIPFNDTRTEVFYLGLTKDNRVHIGGGPVDYVFNNGFQEPANSEKRYATLRSELGRIFPELAAEPFETKWSGSVDMSLDETPAVGRMGKHENLYYAIGFSGHGVNLTSVFGRVLADLIAGKSADWNWLPYLDRLPPYTPNEPLRWLGVNLALGYYRLTDPSKP